METELGIFFNWNSDVLRETRKYIPEQKRFRSGIYFPSLFLTPF